MLVNRALVNFGSEADDTRTLLRKRLKSSPPS